METIEQVFGSDTAEPLAPEMVIDGLVALKDEYKVSVEEIKQKYVDLLNLPVVQLQGEGRWLAALRALKARYISMFALTGKSVPYRMAVLGIGRPIPEADKSFNIRIFGFVKNIDSENKAPLEGPADVRIGGFTSIETAQRFADGLSIEKVYDFVGTPSSKAPTGILTDGKTGFIFANSNTPWTPVTNIPADSVWAKPFDSLFNLFPQSQIRSIMMAATQYTPYRIQASIINGFVSKTKGNSSANITVSDDSIDKEIAAKHGGGLRLWLPPAFASYASLSVGSVIEALVSGYQRQAKDSSGNVTGTDWAFNFITGRILMNLSGSDAVPNPEQMAVSIPDEKPVRKRLF